MAEHVIDFTFQCPWGCTVHVVDGKEQLHDCPAVRALTDTVGLTDIMAQSAARALEPLVRDLRIQHGRDVALARLDDRDAMARVLAGLESDEDWPTNEALGGSLTGTRDDEFRDEMLVQADAVIAFVRGDRG